VNDEWLEKIWPEVISIAAGPSRSIARKYSGYVEREDLKQSMVEWAIRHPHKIHEYLDREDVGERRGGTAALMQVFWREGDRIARREKAAQSGYRPEDEWFYSIAQIRDAILAILNGQTEHMGVTSESERRSVSDPANGGNARAIVADIMLAMRDLTSEEQFFIQTYVLDEPGGRQMLGELYEMSVDSLSKKAHRLLSKMRAMLGGPSPYTNGDD
jgi:hypothetical protein